jgi:hypothetical protein
MIVSDLLEQPCNKSDNAIKLHCYNLLTAFIPNLLQQLGTSSANTTCRQLVNRFVTSCYRSANKLLQICSQAVDKLSSHCLFPVVVTSLEQAVNNL